MAFIQQRYLTGVFRDCLFTTFLVEGINKASPFQSRWPLQIMEKCSFLGGQCISKVCRWYYSQSWPLIEPYQCWIESLIRYQVRCCLRCWIGGSIDFHDRHFFKPPLELKPELWQRIDWKKSNTFHNIDNFSGSNSYLMSFRNRPEGPIWNQW